ncbi:MAG TPA: gluconate 2-dehydrogenase subunit 3 family protein [Longimicrobiales bacterium]
MKHPTTAGDPGAGGEPNANAHAHDPEGISRRQVLELMAAVPLAAALETTPAGAERAVRVMRQAAEERRRGGKYAPAFFTPHEWQTVRLLADLIIPRDERSGSATDAGVPEFMDFMMMDRPRLQTRMRGGLRWLDNECRRRFGQAFVDATPEQQTAILDDIAWPDRAPAALSQGVAFFNFFRDMTASGFFSSKMGVEDLQYTGNTVVPEWTGCPEPALRKLGVRYGEG